MNFAVIKTGGKQYKVYANDVIKVENPDEPDQSRYLGTDAKLNDQLMGTGFLTQGSNKRSVTVDLKTESGRAIFKKLVQHDDVIGRVGRADRDVAERKKPQQERLLEAVIAHAVELDFVARLVEHALSELQPLGRELVLGIAHDEPFP